MELAAVLLESFRRNGLVNAALLEHLTPADLDLSDGVGGLSIGQHLEHVVGMRKYWLGKVAPELASSISFSTLEGDNPFWELTLELPALAAAFEEADHAMLEAVQAAYTEDRTFSEVYSSDPAHFLQHTLVHDAHHRGQIMVLLRQQGRTLEQMNAIDRATWPVWKL